MQQPNNFKKKVNTALKKKPDLTETYPAFILLSDRKVDSLFIGKNCSKLGITLDTINNYQSNNDFFALTNGCILEIDEYCKKSHLSNTHFADIVNRLSLGKFEFDRCSINNNVEVLKKEVRKFQRLPLSNRSSTSISNNNEFSDQLFIPTTKKIKDPLQEAKKTEKKLNLKITELLNVICSLEKKMILLNETLREETKNKLEKGEKMRTCFQEIKALQKDREKLSSELTKKMETLSRLNTGNANKRISRIKNKNIDLTKENEGKTLQLEEFKVVNDQLVSDLDKALAEEIKYRKRHYIIKENMKNLMTVKMTSSSQLPRT